MRGVDAAAFSLTCGPQTPHRAVRIEYGAKKNDELGATGLVRVAELK